ncbi:hypothetical protein HL658_12045 [Azospirillum sp. RWY-5-1]|uniref:Mobilization protein n=1 Tax=Azospirillum oleiclasticum TaxID=2735135 RepID=A0ABX2T8B3_9PROT|nr:hypothetical protein [Azospirillum oleiclasticum]NYZ13285.1 hypothetical protein [Azospirillum oleiclasticum]NYZ20446.1 hypothetical protein [Azospirillum oleiclasticum]
MTISDSGIAGWLDSLTDGDLADRRRAAEQRRARAEQTLARLSADSRKIDTRRKIVLGGALMAAARRDQEIRAVLYRVLNAEIVAPRDRALLGLPPRAADGAAP